MNIEYDISTHSLKQLTSSNFANNIIFVIYNDNKVLIKTKCEHATIKFCLRR